MVTKRYRGEPMPRFAPCCCARDLTRRCCQQLAFSTGITYVFDISRIFSVHLWFSSIHCNPTFRVNGIVIKVGSVEVVSWANPRSFCTSHSGCTSFQRFWF